MKKIIVIPSGWVFVGEYSFDAETGDHVLDDASNIRIWGTTKGLGQLAIEGRQAETITDYVGRFTCKSYIFAIDCTDKW